VSVTPTAEQRAIIDAQEGTVVVLAAVGSGKTTTLALRIAAGLQAGADPERMLALTFTNRAAEQIRTALAAQIGLPAARKVFLATFHGLCNRLLRLEFEAAGLPADFGICDEHDAADILTDLKVSRPRNALFGLAGEMSAVPPGQATLDGWLTGAFSEKRYARDYVTGLRDRGAVDFGSLVLLTRALLTTNPAVRARWASRFDVVLIDEMQDTHLSEYDVLATVAERARSFCLVGDLDQTIYGWRGSAPRELLEALARDFGPVRRLALTANFRATRSLLSLADRFAEAMTDRATVVRAHDSLADGAAPTLRTFPSEQQEWQGVAGLCDRLIARGQPAASIAVLVRTNIAVRGLSAAMAEAQVPHATAAQFQFYRRVEIKDALSLAQLVHRRNDETAALRVCGRLHNRAMARQFARVGREHGLRLSDLLDRGRIARGDPLSILNFEQVILLDTETTGLDHTRDDVIEIAAVRIGPACDPFAIRPEDTFSVLVRTDRDLGPSAAVHGITPEQLAADGVAPADALKALRAFIGDTPITGHNIRFDVGMLRAMSRRLGEPLSLTVAFDTLPMARRLLPGPRFSLDELVERFDLQPKPTHRALDDVKANVSLLRLLRERASEGADVRRRLVAAAAPRFAQLRRKLDHWAYLELRPAPLVARAVDDLLQYQYPPSAPPLTQLNALIARLEALDDPGLPAEDALRHVLDRAALVRDVDGMGETSGVRILTMHQSKGLEFPVVILPGLVDGRLPSHHTVRSGDPARFQEELRLLYVAVTRARSEAHLSTFEVDDRGKPREMSRFLRGIQFPEGKR